MERKKDSARSRRKALEDAHAENLRRKERLDMEAAEKNAQAAEVEQQVRRACWVPESSLRLCPCRSRGLCLPAYDSAQIRGMHASLQSELEKGEKAFKRIKDQVSA